MKDRFSEMMVESLRKGLNPVMTSSSPHVLNNNLIEQIYKIEEQVGEVKLDIKVAITRVLSESELEDREAKRMRGPD